MTTTLPAPLHATGITYRQLDYWTRCGYITALHDGGAGNYRAWANSELAVAALIARLRGAGLELPAAASVARTATEHPGPALNLAPGITIHIDPDMP